MLGRLVTAGHWQPGDPNVLIVTDAGYDVTRLAFVLSDLPVDLVGRSAGSAATGSCGCRNRPEPPEPPDVRAATARKSR